MRLDPTSLRLFVSVVETRTIAAAAEREHIAPSAVSRRISELETALKTELLARSNRGIRPTPAGVALLNLARGVLHDLDEIQAQMRSYSSGTRGHVTVFANISAITRDLPEQLSSFLAEHPLVNVHLEEKNTTAAIAQAVAEYAADIGIFTMLPHPHTLEYFPYHGDELVVLARKDHPLARKSAVSFAEIARYDFVGMHAGGGINTQMVEAAAKLGQSLRVRARVSSHHGFCLMVNAGLGIGILPKHSVQPYLKTLPIRAIPLNEPWAKRKLVLSVRAYAELSVAARLLVDHLHGKQKS
jgi:DNA-binding transcriptional LysR family regulator